MTRARSAGAALLSLAAVDCTALVSFDGYDTGAASGSGAGCGPLEGTAASSLVDGFDGPSESWGNSECVSFDGDHLVVPAPTVNGDACLYTTVTAYRLACDAIHVRVRQAPAAAWGLQAAIYVDPADGEGVSAQLVLENGTFQFGDSDGNAIGDIADNTFDPERDLWWRLRAASGSIRFETSDGGPWIDRGGGEIAATLDQCRVSLGTNLYREPVTSPPAIFDCYNVPLDACP